MHRSLSVCALLLFATSSAHAQPWPASVFPLQDAKIAIAMAKAACPNVPTTATWTAGVGHINIDNGRDVPDFWLVRTVNGTGPNQIISTVTIAMDGPPPTACRQVPGHLIEIDPRKAEKP